jgi:hypothetical protein
MKKHLSTESGHFISCVNSITMPCKITIVRLSAESSPCFALIFSSSLPLSRTLYFALTINIGVPLWNPSNSFPSLSCFISHYLQVNVSPGRSTMVCFISPMPGRSIHSTKYADVTTVSSLCIYSNYNVIDVSKVLLATAR